MARRTLARRSRHWHVTASSSEGSGNGVPVARIGHGLGKNEEGHMRVLTQAFMKDVGQW
jgi:hypothetical protein